MACSVEQVIPNSAGTTPSAHVEVVLLELVRLQSPQVSAHKASASLGMLQIPKDLASAQLAAAEAAGNSGASPHPLQLMGQFAGRFWDKHPQCSAQISASGPKNFSLPSQKFDDVTGSWLLMITRPKHPNDFIALVKDNIFGASSVVSRSMPAWDEITVGYKSQKRCQLSVVFRSWHCSWLVWAIASSRQAFGQPWLGTLNHGRLLGSAQPQVRGQTSRKSLESKASHHLDSSAQDVASACPSWRATERK